MARNSVRRHLTSEAKAQAMHKMAGRGWSQRKIAKAFSMSQPGVSKLMDKYPPADGTPQAEVTEGADGKSYQRSRRMTKQEREQLKQERGQEPGDIMGVQGQAGSGAPVGTRRRRRQGIAQGVERHAMVTGHGARRADRPAVVRDAAVDPRDDRRGHPVGAAPSGTGRCRMTTTDDGELLTIGQVAERCGLDVIEVRRLVAAGTVPVVRRGRRVLVPARWVEMFIATLAEGGL